MARIIGQGHQAGIATAGGMAVGSFIYVLAIAMGAAYLGMQYFLLAGVSTSRQKLQRISLHKIFDEVLSLN